MKKDNRKPPTERRRFQLHQNFKQLGTLTKEEKIQHFRDSVLNARAQAAQEGGRGQPPMVERFRAAAIMVDALESKGVPFGVGPNSRMNKELLKLLNEEARLSVDSRKSRRKEITAGAVRSLLREIDKIRKLGDHFIKLPPYSD